MDRMDEWQTFFLSLVGVSGQEDEEDAWRYCYQRYFERMEVALLRRGTAGADIDDILSAVATDLRLRLARTRSGAADGALHRAMQVFFRRDIRGDPREAFKAWLYTCLRNENGNVIRRRAREAGVTLPEPAAADDPEQTAEWRELLRRARDRIDTLSELERTILEPPEGVPDSDLGAYLEAKGHFPDRAAHWTKNNIQVLRLRIRTALRKHVMGET